METIRRGRRHLRPHRFGSVVLSSTFLPCGSLVRECCCGALYALRAVVVRLAGCAQMWFSHGQRQLAIADVRSSLDSQRQRT